MPDQKGFPDKPTQPGAVTIYMIRGRDGVPKMVCPEEFPPLPQPAHRFDLTDLFTAGQMWEYIEAERECAAGVALTPSLLEPEANGAAFEAWLKREWPDGLVKGESVRQIARNGWDAGLMHGRSIAGSNASCEGCAAHGLAHPCEACAIEVSDAESKVAKIMHMVRELVRDACSHTGESTANLELQEFCVMDELRELAGLPVMQPGLDLREDARNRASAVVLPDADGWVAELMRLADRYAKATELWSHSLGGSPEDNKAAMTRQKAECRAALLAHASGIRAVPAGEKAQPDAWQMRRYYTGDDAGWGMWKECSADEAQKWTGSSDIQVRPLYANPPD